MVLRCSRCEKGEVKKCSCVIGYLFLLLLLLLLVGVCVCLCCSVFRKKNLKKKTGVVVGNFLL